VCVLSAQNCVVILVAVSEKPDNAISGHQYKRLLFAPISRIIDVARCSGFHLEADGHVRTYESNICRTKPCENRKQPQRCPMELIPEICVYAVVYISLLRVYDYTVSHKYTPKFIDHNLKADYRILITFRTTIPDTTCYKSVIQISTSPNICCYTFWGNQNT